MIMKKIVWTLVILTVVSALTFSCKNTSVKEGSKVAEVGSETNANLILVAKNIVTEVIVKPDTLGEPWEVEKVKNYNGILMFNDIFEKIYNKKLVVYDIYTSEPLDPSAVKKTVKDFGGNISKIAKIQFDEDWYFNSMTNKLVKKMKWVSFAYEIQRQDGLPVGYVALFKIKIDE
jgi:hypothetical protein